MNPVTTAVVVALVGLAPTGALLAARVRGVRRWRRSLVAFRVSIAADTDIASVAQWLTAISTWTHPGRWGFLPRTPIVIETVADIDGIGHYLVIPASYRASLLAGLQALLPGARVEEAAYHVAQQAAWTVAGEWKLSTTSRPLNTDTAEHANALIISGMQPLGAGEQIRIQWILTGAHTPDPISRFMPAPADAQWKFDNDTLIRDSESLRARRDKQKYPLLRATGRVAVEAGNKPRARALFRRVWPAFQTMNAPGVALVRRHLPTRVVTRWIRLRRWPTASWPLLLNVEELAGLIGVPICGVALPGVTQSASRLLPTPTSMAGEGGVTLGTTNYPGSNKPVTVQT
ncbi:MAG: hypothetical protein ACRDQZ_05595, partial [Mycobacteriales bacterium]